MPTRTAPRLEHARRSRTSSTATAARGQRPSLEPAGTPTPPGGKRRPRARPEKYQMRFWFPAFCCPLARIVPCAVLRGAVRAITRIVRPSTRVCATRAHSAAGGVWRFLGLVWAPAAVVGVRADCVVLRFVCDFPVAHVSSRDCSTMPGMHALACLLRELRGGPRNPVTGPEAGSTVSVTALRARDV